MVLWISPKLWNKIGKKCTYHWRTDFWVIKGWVGNKWEWYCFSGWCGPGIVCTKMVLYISSGWIIRFHSRKLIKNSFEGFLNDIGKHIKTASVRHSYGDIINKTTIFFLPFWAFLSLSACHTSQQEPTSTADFQDLWIVSWKTMFYQS